MKIYVAGPMSHWPDKNKLLFDRTARGLELLGHEALNPMTLERPVEEEKDWNWYMKEAIKMLLEADAVCVLPDWQTSRGATLEVRIAHELRMPVLTMTGWVGRGTVEK